MPDVLLWDYDGTIADSVVKNYYVTLEMLRRSVPHISEHLPKCLESAGSFEEMCRRHDSWREMYRTCYGMTDEEVERAGRIWGECQRACRVTPPLFDGIAALMERFSDMRQGIVSQNSSDEIRAVLQENGVGRCVGYVCGYTDVPQFSPKPSPVPFLKCAEQLPIRPGSDRVVYIGDHAEDVEFVYNIRAYYRDRGAEVSVASIAVSYSGSNPYSWAVQPDAIAHSVEELERILEKMDEQTSAMTEGR